MKPCENILIFEYFSYISSVLHKKQTGKQNLLTICLVIFENIVILQPKIRRQSMFSNKNTYWWWRYLELKKL